MAVLEKIRVKFGLGATIIIALGLLSFIISPDDLERAFQSMSSKYDVGKVGGKSISYDDFKADVDNLTHLTGQSSLNAQQQEEIRDMAWQKIIYKYLFIKNAEKAGIRLGEDEKVALTTGSMVSPMISRNALFFDEDGNTTGITTMNDTNGTNGTWYTMDGRRLSGKPTKAGLYIYGNIKVAIK